MSEGTNGVPAETQGSEAASETPKAEAEKTDGDLESLRSALKAEREQKRSAEKRLADLEKRQQQQSKALLAALGQSDGEATPEALTKALEAEKASRADLERKLEEQRIRSEFATLAGSEVHDLDLAFAALGVSAGDLGDNPREQLQGLLDGLRKDKPFLFRQQGAAQAPGAAVPNTAGAAKKRYKQSEIRALVSSPEYQKGGELRDRVLAAMSEGRIDPG